MQSGFPEQKAESLIFSQNRAAFLVLGALVLFLLYQVFSAYHTLPARVPAHFNFGGRPDRWMSRRSFFALELILILVTAASFGLLPLLFQKIPLRFVNLPNKEYWFAPGRRQETVARLVGYLLWLGNATLLFFYFLFGKIDTFAQNPRGTLSFWPELTAYLLFVFVWTVKLFLEFSKVKKEQALN